MSETTSVMPYLLTGDYLLGELDYLLVLLFVFIFVTVVLDPDFPLNQVGLLLHLLSKVFVE